MPKLKVAIIAPPWLAIPSKGYGGIEMVVYGLVNGLRHQGVKTVLFTNGASTTTGMKRSLYAHEQFKYIQRPYYESSPIIFSHLMYALNEIRRDGSFDIIHDHNPHVGPSLLSLATKDKDIPPALHTLHGPPFKTGHEDIPSTEQFWERIEATPKFRMVGISKSLVAAAPKHLRDDLLPPVYNGIDPTLYPFKDKKQNYFLTLARFSTDKGQHLAIQVCRELGDELRMAGTVAGITSTSKLLLELANPLSSYRSFADFRYFSDQIYPHTVANAKIRFVGNASGATKLRLIANAKALLFPIGWDEPFGMAVIEALACGTPVVAMKRGSMMEIIEHGVNGFLAKNPEEFKHYAQLVDQIDPAACRKSVEERFSIQKMAENYIERYRSVVNAT